MLSNAGRVFIGGKWLEPQGSTTLAVENPATESSIGAIVLGSEADVDLAVAAALEAGRTYREASKDERIALLRRIREVYVRRYEEMAAIISAELGAPITMARDQQTATGLGHLDAFIGALEQHSEQEELPNGDLIIREPIGVCSLITPWNWPINQIALKVLPAIAAGCTCVLKPSEVTPLSGVLFAEILEEAGIPPGVFNLVQGEGACVGSALTKHPDVDMVSFTGSTRAGVAIAKAGAETVKRVTLELGGKSPCIIFADADLPAAVAKTVYDCMNNTGQSCDAPTRLLVERVVYEEVLDLTAKAVDAINLGNPALEGDHLGPLVSAIQYDRVQLLIQAAIEDGATLLRGGPGKPTGFDVGHFVRPTVFRDVSNDMMIAREEVFGPVLVVMPFDSEEEAINIANDTPYGLAAYFHTADALRQARVTRKLRAGMIHVNGGDVKYGSPFGGCKMSGNGREGGRWGLDDYVEVKVLHR